MNAVIFRSHKYCDIPACNKEKTSLSQSERLVATSFTQTLTCGCLAFGYSSHLVECKCFNLAEDQPYYPGCLS